MDSFSSSSTYSSIVLAISAVTSRPCTTISSGRWNCQSCSSGSRSGLVLLFALALFSMTATNASSAAIGGSEYFLLEAEPAFADGGWPTGILPINSRQFVGIRTLHPSKAVFGARQLKERLAEQHQQTEQRREQRQAAAPIPKLAYGEEPAEPMPQQMELKRRQRVYDRLMCMAALQSLAQCKDI